MKRVNLIVATLLLAGCSRAKVPPPTEGDCWAYEPSMTFTCLGGAYPQVCAHGCQRTDVYKKEPVK